MLYAFPDLLQLKITFLGRYWKTLHSLKHTAVQSRRT